MTKVAHLVETAGTGKIIMSLTDGVYDAALGAVVGVTKLAGAAPAGSFTETPVNGVRKGMIGSVVVTVKDIPKNKNRRLVVSLEKLDTCIAELPGKSLQGKVILSARFPIRRRLR